MMQDMPTIGNDIVDLREGRQLRKHNDTRFMDRVFCTAEKNLILASQDPDQTLWQIWAAKEAAYKALKKKHPGLIFAHRKFVTDLVRSRVVHQKHIVRIRFQLTWHFIHCVAWSGTLKRSVDIKSRVSRRTDEDRCQSTAVRQSALTLLRDECGIQTAEVRREVAWNGLSPPYFSSNDARIERMELSLSHDGAWVAAALLPRV